MKGRKAPTNSVIPAKAVRYTGKPKAMSEKNTTAPNAPSINAVEEAKNVRRKSHQGHSQHEWYASQNDFF